MYETNRPWCLVHDTRWVRHFFITFQKFQSRVEAGSAGSRLVLCRITCAIIANFKPQNYLKFPAPPKQAVKHTDMGNQQARRMASAAIGEVESGNVVDESVSSPIRKSPLAPLTYGWVEAVSWCRVFLCCFRLVQQLRSNHIFSALYNQPPDFNGTQCSVHNTINEDLPTLAWTIWLARKSNTGPCCY